MDDGSLSKVAASASICTHSFTKKEVQLLIDKLCRLGIYADMRHDNHMKKAKIGGWYITMNAEATREFITMIKPYLHESMAYKGEINMRPVETVNCQFCGAPMPMGPRQDGHMTVCDSDECQKQRHKILNAKYRTQPGKQKELNEKYRAHYVANLEESRRRGREDAQRRLQDPAYRAQVNEQRRIRNAQRKLENPPIVEMVTCSFCGDEIPRANRRKDAPMVACSKKECKAAKHMTTIRAIRAKAPKKEPAPKKMAPCGYCGEMTPVGKNNKGKAPTCSKPECMKAKRRDRHKIQYTPLEVELVNCSFCGDKMPRGTRKKGSMIFTCTKTECKRKQRNQRNATKRASANC